MRRYIDADKLIELANNTKDKTIDANDIARFPTADVVEVVRCKDCIYYSDGECKSGILPFSEYSDLQSVWLAPKPDDYCSCGERAEK